MTYRSHSLPHAAGAIRTLAAATLFALLPGCGGSGFAFALGTDEVLADEPAARPADPAPPLVVDLREPA